MSSPATTVRFCTAARLLLFCAGPLLLPVVVVIVELLVEPELDVVAMPTKDDTKIVSTGIQHGFLKVSVLRPKKFNH